MDGKFISKAEINIDAPLENVWDALVNPKIIKQYMFGADVISDWKEGSPIIFKGEYGGKSYNDKGIILKIKPKKLLEYTHWSELSGFPDIPENYHKLTFTLKDIGHKILLSLVQDNNTTKEARKHADQFWTTVLAMIKQLVEENTQ